MGVKIVTDSTSDLPKELAEEYGVTVVPLNVHFEDEVFVDGVTINQDEFLAKLTTSKVMPRTSQPSPGSFREVYEKLTADGSQVISVHIGEKLSGTLQSARMAAEMLPEADITVVDSKNATMALGLLVLLAAEAARSGQGKDEILQMLEKRIAEAGQGNVILVDTLEYLQKNGRIGKAASLLGTLLAVKVLIRVDEVVQPAGKERGRSKAVKALINYAQEHAGKTPVRLAVAHVGALDEAEKIAGQLKEVLNVVGEVIYAEIGPVVATHTGPRTVGAFWLPATEN
ncbi:MAG: DegV family protein [Firmicutes bacterium]|nr:DegV family protein [Bacillota bacterium]